STARPTAATRLGAFLPGMTGPLVSRRGVTGRRRDRCRPWPEPWGRRLVEGARRFRGAEASRQGGADRRRGRPFGRAGCALGDASMRHALTIATAVALLLGSASMAEAKQCRNAAGKFAACPAAAAAKPCRDAAGKFVRCSAVAASTAAKP